MIGGIGNMFVSVHCSECQNDEISITTFSQGGQVSMQCSECQSDAISNKRG